MRYNDGGNSSLLETVPNQASPLINLIPPPALSTTTPYSLDGGAFYPSASHVLTGIDVRARLGSNTTPSAGMAHAHRTTALPHPHPGAQLSARDQYSPATPSFRRPSEHPPRSPSFPVTAALRRHPLSPTPSPIGGFANPRMDAAYPSKNPGSSALHPPLGNLVTLGTLQYADGSGTPVKPEIHGVIDKGFFLADNEWTCYRRNYFGCVCSYSLTPYYTNAPLQFTATNSTQTMNVISLAMCISAVVADNDSHTIELVQHTPKRDKGPIAKPEKIRLSPKTAHTNHHGLLYGHEGSLGPPPRTIYGSEAYGQPPSQGAYQTEHTFERIQFKQATANNGKRRAAQQYYHLIVELWAEVANQSPDPFVKIAYKKSAKMIVRGRSPGHYQTDRRGSTSSGPGGGSGSSISGGYPSSSTMLGDSFPSSSMMPGTYSANFDRGGSNSYHSGRHHGPLPAEPLLTPDEKMAIDTPKEYQYYPGSIYAEHQGSQNNRVEMFNHHHHQRSEHDSGGAVAQMAPPTNYEAPMEGKIKTEFDNGVLPPPTMFHAGQLVNNRRCGPFEGKPTSNGYYPTMMPLSQ